MSNLSHKIEPASAEQQKFWKLQADLKVEIDPPDDDEFNWVVRLMLKNPKAAQEGYSYGRYGIYELTQELLFVTEEAAEAVAAALAAHVCTAEYRAAYVLAKCDEHRATQQAKIEYMQREEQRHKDAALAVIPDEPQEGDMVLYQKHDRSVYMLYKFLSGELNDPISTHTANRGEAVDMARGLEGRIFAQKHDGETLVVRAGSKRPPTAAQQLEDAQRRIADLEARLKEHNINS